MVYVDTSALVPVFIREAKSKAVIAWLESSGERLAISEWSLVEFASAVAIKVRTGQAAAKLAKQAIARVREFAQKHCTVAVPGRKEFHRAAELAGNGAFNLSGGRSSPRRRRNSQCTGHSLPRRGDNRWRQGAGDGCRNGLTVPRYRALISLFA